MDGSYRYSTRPIAPHVVTLCPGMCLCPALGESGGTTVYELDVQQGINAGNIRVL